MIENPLDLSPQLKNSSLDVLVGRRLGGGAYRTVFTLKGRPREVIKLETFGKQFCNAAEWRLWMDVQYDPRWSKWFAPCLDIDSFGHALIQARTQPISAWPDGDAQELPAFFTDVKLANFGMLDGRLVCHDYGTTLLQQRGFSRVKMRRIADLPGDHCYD